jgi:LPXTG-motif cell wall-anchored protein
MKKKIMGAILAAALIASQVVTAFAGSKTSEVILPDDFAAYYVVTEGSEESFAEAEAVSPQTVDAIMEVNNGSMTLAQLIADMKELLGTEGAAGLKMTEEQIDALAADLRSRTFVTKFFDLEPVNGGIKDDNGDYLVTLSIPAISSSMTDIAFLHFSTDRAVWEVVEASDVDYANKEITASFKDLSPVAVIAKVDTSADNAIGTSPQTGRFSVSVLWIGAAVILGTAGIVVLRKRKEK